MSRPPPISTLFPYTTLFRSIRWYLVEGGRGQMVAADTQCSTELREREKTYERIDALRQLQDSMTVAQAEGLLADLALRSEEHTSELQSRQYLVCRLLLEKKR